LSLLRSCLRLPFSRLQIVDQAQQEEKEYLEILRADQRKEDAEKAFKQWINRKHSVLLQEAAEELEEAKIQRENTEKKLKLRRALLRAKVLGKSYINTRPNACPICWKAVIPFSNCE